MLSKEKIQSMYDAAVRCEFARNNSDDDDEVQESSYALGCELESVGGLSAAIRKLIDKARAADTELLSLREQLAELKALPPTGFVKIDPYTENCRWDSSDPDYLAGPVTPEGYGSDYIPLFTAVKPAED